MFGEVVLFSFYSPFCISDAAIILILFDVNLFALNIGISVIPLPVPSLVNLLIVLCLRNIVSDAHWDIRISYCLFRETLTLQSEKSNCSNKGFLHSLVRLQNAQYYFVLLFL